MFEFPQCDPDQPCPLSPNWLGLALGLFAIGLMSLSIGADLAGAEVQAEPQAQHRAELLAQAR